jgi:hypothetical protein
LWGSFTCAAPPASVTGAWSVIGNQTVQTLTLVQVAAATACKPINGTLTNGLSDVRGYYCPNTGRIAFARKNRPAGVVIQMWVGNVSDVLAGRPLRMGGTFHAVDTAAGSGLLGEYHFQGVK